MKTFISAIIIFALVLASVFSLSYFFTEKLEYLSALAADIPENAETLDKNKEQGFARIKELYSAWDKSMQVFPYFIGYDMLDRADEAAQTLISCALSGEVNELFSARLKFRDAIERLKELCRINIESVM